MIELKDATLTRDGRQLVSGMSMMALNGQMTCITGGQGSGKTALLEALLGFIPLDSGLVSVDGELLTELSAPTFRRRMAYVPQRREERVETFVPRTDDLETIWSGPVATTWEPRPVGLPAVTLQGRDIVLADDPPLAMLGQLRTLANEGRAVVVATEREEFLNMSDKTIRMKD